MNNVFRLVNPVYNIDTHVFKVHAFTKQAIHEKKTGFFSSFRVFNM